MSPVELPTGNGGDMNPSLLPNAPFGPDDSPYTEESFIPYADQSSGISFSVPQEANDIIRTPDVSPQVSPPEVVEQPSYADSILAQWAAEEEQVKYNEWADKNRPKAAYMGLQVAAESGIPGMVPAIAALDIIQREQNRAALAERFSWLGDEQFPTWENYRDRQYADKWDGFTLEQQRKGFEHWAKSSAEYWIGLRGMKEDVFTTAYQQAVAGGLAGQFTDFTNKQIKEDANWLDSNFSSTYSLMFDEGIVDEANRGTSSDQSIFSKAFDAKKADLIAGKTNEKMRDILEAKNVVSQWGSLDANGKVTKEGIAQARENLTDDFNELENSSDPEDIKEQAKVRARYQRDMAALDRLEKIDNPEAETTKLNEGYQRLRRISQNMKVLQSPSIKEMLGAKTASDFWKSFGSNKLDNMAYFGGEMVSQYIDMVPAIGAGIAAGAEAGPAAPLVVAGAAGAASGRQEYLAVIPELMEERMAKLGLDPANEESWQTVLADDSFYNDVKAQAARKGIVTAAYEGALNALFGHMIKLVKPKGFPKLGWMARRALDVPAGVVSAGAGEIQGQFAQNPDKETDWLAVSQEIAAEWPGQTQQAAMESMSSVYGKFFNKQTPTQTPTDAGATPPAAGAGDISLESIQRELGAEIPKASTEVTEKNGPQANAQNGNVATPSGQDLAGQNTPAQEPVRSAEESAQFFASLPQPKDAFESAQAIVDSKDAAVLSPEEVEQANLLEQLSPEERAVLSQMKLAKLGERQKAQQALKEDANYRANIIKATRDIGKETSPIEQSKGKGMSVQESNRRNQGGFADLEAVFDGVNEFAVNTWATAQDFGVWATEMITKYTNKIVPHLERLWNSISSAVTWAKDFLTYTGNKEKGTIDLRQPRTDNRPSAGGPFKYSLSPYDETNSKIGKYPIAKSGVIPENEFISVNRDPVQLKRSEFEFYKTIVPDAFKDGMVDVKKLYEGLRDSGPQVTVTKYGQREEERSPDIQAYQDFRHNWYDNLSFNEQETYDSISFNGITAENEIEKRLIDGGFSNEQIANAFKLRDLAKKAKEEFEKKANKPTLAATEYYDQISPLETTSNPVIRIDLTINQKEESSEEFGPILKYDLWSQDNLHENMPNTYGWAMVQPTVNPLTGRPAWLIAELQSRWAQALKGDKESIHIPNHPLLATHQKAVINAVIDEARKAGIESIIVSDAETAMMTEMHDRHTMIPNGSYVLPSGETYVISENTTTYYQAGESTENSAGKQIQAYNREYAALKEAAQRGDVPTVVKQEKGMRMAYDVTLPSIAKEVTGRVGIPVDLGPHKNNQSVYTYEGDLIGEGSNYFKTKDGKPKSTITGLAYDITEAGPRAAMLFADVFGVKLVADSVRIAFRGAKELAGFTAQIVKELGKWIEPYAQKLWDTMRTAPQKLEEVVSEIAAAEAPRKTGRILAKTMKKVFANLPAKSPLLGPLNSISWEFLPYTERRDLMRLARDYFRAKEGKGPIVSQQLLQRALETAAKSSYTRGFAKLKAQNPLSLAGKSESDFLSVKDIRGYIGSLDNAEGEKIRTRHKARVKAPDTRKKNRSKEADAAFDSAKMEITNGIAREMLGKLSPMMRIQAEKALEVIGKIDQSKMTDSEKEHITAAVQNIADGSWIGVHAILARAEAAEAIAIGNAVRKKIGGFLSLPLTGAVGWVVDKGSKGALPQSFARHDVRERIAHLAPVAKQWWSKYIAKYATDGLRVAKTMQLENTAEIERIIKKWGFSHSLVGGIANHTMTLSAKRTGLAALLTQYREGNNAIQDINTALKDVMRGIMAMQNDKSSVYKAIGQIEGNLLKDFIIKAGKAGMLAQDEEGNLQVAVDPEVWSSFIYSQLTPNEQGALNDIRAFAGRYTNDIGFVQEFVYGKEWQPWTNYVMRQAMTLDGTEAVNPQGMELDASTMANNEFATPVGKTQSILNPRVGLAKGQFYNLDIFHTALHGMNQAAYEVGTAQARMELKALFEDPLSDGLWDSAADKKLTYKIYKDIHQKSLGIETGTSIQGTPGAQIAAWAFIRPMDAWVGLVMNSVTQLIKQAASPMAAYILTDGAIGHFFNSIGHFYHSDVWDNKGREAFFAKATPDLLIRLKTYDPAFDDLVGSGLVEEIRRIAKDRNFIPLTVEQKRLKNLGRIMNWLDPVASVPIWVSRQLNTKPDQIAASRIFLSEYSRYLMKIGMIKDISEFTPDTPYHYDAARHADQVVTEILGGASSREKRPNVLSYVKPFGVAGRIPAILARRILMNLSGINTQIASDTFRSIGEAVYNNPKDPEGSKAVRHDANLRIRRNIIQMGTFIASSYLLAWVIQNGLVFGFGSSTGLDDWEGLDEEEKRILERVERARYEAQKGYIGVDKAIQDIGMMLTGGMTQNSIAAWGADKTSSLVFEAFFEEDYKENIAAMEKEMKKTTDKNRKLKIRQNLDTAKAIKAQMDFRKKMNLDFGQVDAYGDMSNYLLRSKTVSNGEADRIAMEYYEQTKGKPGAMKKAPSRSGMQKTTRAMVDNVLRLASTDIGRAQDKVNKARAIVMSKRKAELESAEKNKRPAKPIDTTFGSLYQQATD